MPKGYAIVAGQHQPTTDRYADYRAGTLDSLEPYDGPVHRPRRGDRVRRGLLGRAAHRRDRVPVDRAGARLVPQRRLPAARGDPARGEHRRLRPRGGRRLTMRRRLALATVLAALGPAAAAHAVTTVGSDLSKTRDAARRARRACTLFTGDDDDRSASDRRAVRRRDRALAGEGRVRCHRACAAHAALGRHRLVYGVGHERVRARAAGRAPPPSHRAWRSRRATSSAWTMAAGRQGRGDRDDQRRIYLHARRSARSRTFPAKQTGRELLVNADIEHDADGDGYGDETAGPVPGRRDAAHDVPVEPVDLGDAPSPAPLTVGRSLTFTVKVVQRGAEHGAGRRPRAEPPVLGDAAAGPRRARLVRRLVHGDLQPGRRSTATTPRTVVLTVRPSSSGRS